MKKTRKKLKPRYIFLISATVILIVSYVIYLLCVGGSYSVPLLSLGRINEDTVTVTASRDDVVRVEKIRSVQTGELFGLTLIDVKSIGQGDVTLSVSYEDTAGQFLSSLNADMPDAAKEAAQEDRQEKSFELNVNPFGFIYNKTDDAFNGLWVLQPLLVIETMLVIIVLFLSFREKRKAGRFSYSMVALGGVMLYLFIGVCISIGGSMLIMNKDMLAMTRTTDILSTLMDGGVIFVIITLLPLLIFAAALCISNIRLVRREGFRPQNLLGFLLGFAVVGGVIMLYLPGRAFSGSTVELFISRVVVTEFSFIFCYFECMLVSTIVCAVSATRYKVNEPMDYLIILGCAIRPDGTPTPLLRGRVDRALEFDRRQSELYGKKAKFVPSGGQGGDEVISEAESMKRYLMEQGVEEERILKEDRSVNTLQNMSFSKKVIEDDAGDLSKARVAFSTTNYHVFRGYTLANLIDMKVKGLSAKTKLYFYPNAFLREFIGLLWNQKLRHLAFIGISTLVMTLMTLIVWF